MGGTRWRQLCHLFDGLAMGFVAGMSHAAGVGFDEEPRAKPPRQLDACVRFL